jgi:hypothetical protein
MRGVCAQLELKEASAVGDPNELVVQDVTLVRFPDGLAMWLVTVAPRSQPILAVTTSFQYDDHEFMESLKEASEKEWSLDLPQIFYALHDVARVHYLKVALKKLKSAEYDA